MDERLARMALATVIEPGDSGLGGLLSLHSAGEVWQSLRTGEPSGAWAKRARSLEPEAVAIATQRVGARFLIPGDAEWPTDSLADLELCDPVQGMGGAPIGLWVLGPGNLKELAASGVALVGSRASTAYGENAAVDLAAALAERGVGVISGGAFGIDAAAHRGALAVGGSTVAVLACGVDTDYPPGNASLLARIRDSGLVVSELAPGQHPTRPRFLVRNRLIAALAGATVIVEAAARSGAANTAAWTLALSRPLLAVPGPITSAMSVTPHRLIREQKATLVTDAEEVLELLRPLGCRSEASAEGEASLRPLDTLTEVEAAVREALPTLGASATEVALIAGLEVVECLTALSELEDRGFVRRDQWGFWLPIKPKRTMSTSSSRAS